MSKRLDVYLTENGLAASRAKAQQMIASHAVLVNGLPAGKAGQTVKETDRIEIVGKTNPFVSRGGLKLQKALDVFGISLAGRIAMDVGASTGGFTDCMLQSGAQKVYAVDVGSGQLAPQLLSDPRVINKEKTNIRMLTPSDIGEQVSFLSIDVSFISLTLALPAAKALLSADGEMVALIKPQFEAGKQAVGKKGVVKDPRTHIRVLQEVAAFCETLGLYPAGLTFSPIRGPEGNIEYLLYLKQQPTGCTFDFAALVRESHTTAIG